MLFRSTTDGPVFEPRTDRDFAEKSVMASFLRGVYIYPLPGLWGHPSALHQEFELCGIRDTSSKRHQLVTLGSCRSLDGLEKWISWSTSKEIVEEPRFRCERSCAHLTGVVKSNSSGIEVWSGSLIQAGSRSRELSS